MSHTFGEGRHKLEDRRQCKLCTASVHWGAEFLTFRLYRPLSISHAKGDISKWCSSSEVNMHAVSNWFLGVITIHHQLGGAWACTFRPSAHMCRKCACLSRVSSGAPWVRKNMALLPFMGVGLGEKMDWIHSKILFYFQGHLCTDIPRRK